jgi:hypothetical protein
MHDRLCRLALSASVCALLHALQGGHLSMTQAIRGKLDERRPRARATSRRTTPRALFEGFFLGGFECSCQKLADGRRLDLLATTRHDELVDRDYARLRSVGNPFEAARGVELKAQLVRAAIEAIEAIRAVLPDARFLQPEPVIAIVPAREHPKTWARVESDNLLQYQAWDMLTGRVWPSLGGRPEYLDIVGVNFYPDNQFMLDGTTIRCGDERYTPFSRILLDVWERYRRPMIVSETGSEGAHRAPWLRYVAGECRAALRQGCDLHGVTLYPVVNHPGWADDRHCHNGLWDYAGADGERAADPDMLAELRAQTPRLTAARAEMLRRRAESEAPATEG